MNPKTIALGERQRADILRNLAERPEGMRGPDLAGAIGCSQGSFSLRINSLMTAGLVAKCGNSTHTRYCLPHHVEAVTAAIQQAMHEAAERRRLADAAKRRPLKGQPGFKPRPGQKRYRWPDQAPRVAEGPRVASVWQLAECVRGEVRGQA